MKKSGRSHSQGKTYSEIGQFWDSHDVATFWEHTGKTDFTVDIQSEIVYYAIDKVLSQQFQTLAQKRGVAPDALVNLILQEGLHESVREASKMHESHCNGRHRHCEARSNLMLRDDYPEKEIASYLAMTVVV